MDISARRRARTPVLTLVLDASVVLTWLFGDEESETAEDLFRVAYEHGAHVPVMLPIEVGNALNVAVRRDRMTIPDWYKAIAVLDALPLIIDDFDAGRTLREVTRIARTFTLSVYDAMYLELSIRRGLPIASYDAQLRSAAHAAGVELWHADRS